MTIPAPSLCPECRAQRRLAFRNERKLYPHKCNKCGKDTISVYRSSSPMTVYCQRCWWSDSWEPLSYGRDYDFSRPFFEQFADLYHTLPQIALMNDNGVASDNCEYTQDFAFGHNCYLIMASWKIRDCMYGDGIYSASDIVDCTETGDTSELAYECIHVENVYHCAFLMCSENCNNCWFGFDLKGCKDCFGCFGLRQKQYYIFNQPYSEEEYHRKIAAYNVGSYQNLEILKAQFANWLQQFPKKHLNMNHCENSLGNNLSHCKDSIGFDLAHTDNCKYFVRSDGANWCYDIHQSGNPQWCMECITPDNSYMTAFSLWCWKDKNVFYSDNCHSSEYLFGCSGLKHAKYCILNTQYTKEQYEELLPRIIEHMRSTEEWGEFFPVSISPFSYTDTLAGERYPLTKEQILQLGAKWEGDSSAAVTTTTDFTIPDHIQSVDEGLLKQKIACKQCYKGYFILPQELTFYRKLQLPIPRLCFYCRHLNRLARQAPRHLSERTCSDCNMKLLSAYTLDMEPKVVCEPCYSKYIN